MADITGADDQFDADLPLEEFEGKFLDESDAELERKRKIMRNPIYSRPRTSTRHRRRC